MQHCLFMFSAAIHLYHWITRNIAFVEADMVEVKKKTKLKKEALPIALVQYEKVTYGL